MNNIEELIRLNAELEGLLRTLASRDSEVVRNVIADKYREYAERFDSLLAGEAVHAAAMESVKIEEAEAPEMEDEMDQAITEIMPVEDDEDENYDPFDDDSHEVVQNVSFDDNSIDEMRTDEYGDINPATHNVPENSGESEMHVDEMLSRRQAIDLKRAFTLNDKFGFRKTLFNQDDAKFTRALEELAEQPTFQEACRFVVDKYGWDLSNPNVDDFMSIIKRHFPA